MLKWRCSSRPVRRASLRRVFRAAGADRAFSLLEVLISMVVLLIGLVAILNFFPQSLRANASAAIKAEAALIAQSRAEALRRDRTFAQDLVARVRSLGPPTPPIACPENPRLTYSYCGVSLLDPVDSPEDPADDFGVPRVIIRYAESWRPSQDVIYELRFAE